MNIVNGVQGKNYLLLGNEAVVRGALEAGVDIVAQYPGTPSSEIGDTFYKIKDNCNYYYEYSTNEKVALEVAASAAASGLNSLTAMKHVGLNVAADSFVSTAYTGIRGGMVIVTSDDPSMHSSQNEQDNRIYARLANMPLLEPATPDQTREFTKQAFKISNKLGMPVILRLTTRISHTRGPVKFGETKPGKGKGYFESNPSKFVPIPVNSYREHRELRERIDKAKVMTDNSNLNRIFSGDNPVGMIASGVGAAYAREIRKSYSGDIPLLTLGFSYPLPKKTIIKFLSYLERVLIVEELEPVLENEIKSMLYGSNLDVEIYGKQTGHLPRLYEYTPGIVRAGLEEILKTGVSTETRTEPSEQRAYIDLPARPPVLCPGCPHRHSYYAVTRAANKFAEENQEPIFTNDIGCYTLGYGEPFQAADYLLSMGASVGTAGGFAQATDQPVIAFIGDSTFYHGGIPALINNIYNKHNMTLVILDNSITAMTGHQPNPGIVFPGEESRVAPVNLEKLIEGLDIDFVRVVDPDKLEETAATVSEALNHDGPSVIISRAPCILMANREKQKRGEKPRQFKVDSEKCTGCRICIDTFACPALIPEAGKVTIDSALCTGCGVCTQVCKFDAIKEEG